METYWKFFLVETAPKFDIRAFSQLMMCRSYPLRFTPVLMKDAQCAESNENWIFLFFWILFFELSWKFIENWGDLSTKMTTYNSKNKNRKKSDTWFFFRFSTFRIFYINLNTYETKNVSKNCLVYNEKLLIIFLGLILVKPKLDCICCFPIDFS